MSFDLCVICNTDSGKQDDEGLDQVIVLELSCSLSVSLSERPSQVLPVLPSNVSAMHQLAL